VSESAPTTEIRHRRPRLTPVARRYPASILLGLVIIGLLAVLVAAILLRPPVAANPLADLTPQADLDRRWGSYLSEREWGNPREAVGADGWGLSWRGAIDTDYRYSDDGIGGMTDVANEFRLGWAFWDGRDEHVTERLMGATNPQGAAGEEITDDRAFRENTPNHSYQRLAYRYPTDAPAFEIQLEAARLDNRRMTMVATVNNLTAEPHHLHVVLKGWLAAGDAVEPTGNGLLLTGGESVVAVVGQLPSDWQITDDKGALDENLRAGDLAGDTGGNIGALDYALNIPAGAVQVIRLGVAEVAVDGEGRSSGAGRTAAEQAEQILRASAEIVEARQQEASSLFVGDVTAHQELYRQALMSLLWNESYYEWDGSSGVDERWGGLVNARDVLIMPDKWEFPWLASWDTAFHAVTATLVDPQLAQDQLRFVLSDRWQQSDGHIPCAEWVMGDECPPIFAWAVWRAYEMSDDRQFLAEVYPGLQRNYDYWWHQNEVGDALFTGGFLGMDNLPRSSGSAQIDATSWMAFFARDMARIASELRDPASSEHYWVDRGRIEESINTRLWDEETRFYYDLNSTGRFVPNQSYSGLIPLIAGVVPPERVPALLDAMRDESRFLSAAGIRSLSAASPIYAPATAGPGVNSNWRGPVWLPINYLLIEALEEVDPALATHLRERVVGAVERDWRRTGRLHEFFDGDSGAGLGADSQGWTSLVANLVSEGWPAGDARP
jgi:hypothetical protein